MGYHAAGFGVVGVDNRRQVHYPFPFILADMVHVAADVWKLTEFDLIHVSPPCQRGTPGARAAGTALDHPDLLEPMRNLLTGCGVPWVIENVPAAPLRVDLILCGAMFGLPLIRHRHFEIDGFKVDQPAHRPHDPAYVTVTGHGGGGRGGPMAGLAKGKAVWQRAMGIDWLPLRKMAQAIPPAYTEFIGAQFR
jgi:hypothetical protein